VPVSGFDAATWGVRGFVGLGVVLLAVLQAPSILFGLGYALSVAIVFGALALVARLLIAAARRIVPAAAPYLVRQGIANLHRPNNQTLLLMLALGLGSFLIGTMVITEETLLRQVTVSSEGSVPNLVFFDIQSDQAGDVRRLVEETGVTVVDEVPIVTMRLASVRGRAVPEIVEDSTTRSRWAFRREYRSTYRDALTSSETLVAGTFVPRSDGGDGLPPVSADADIAGDLGVGIGDTLVWDVQGVRMATVVGSLREIDWRRMQTNFFFVFPAGVLERAPQFTVLSARAESDSASAVVQQRVVAAFPNVSAIDVSLVLDVFDAIFSRIAFIVRFMALFSILTGFIVLSGAVVTSRLQRIEETVLLKTLGASRRQLIRVMLVEYTTLGLLAAATGLLLSLGAGWALARFVFDTGLSAALPRLALVALGVTAVVVAIGAASSRGVYRRQALEVLRAET
jgi:putative ABC transport system permease protein